jgi:transposase
LQGNAQTVVKLSKKGGFHYFAVWLRLSSPLCSRGFMLLPRWWVVERNLAWLARLSLLARDCEQLPETLAGLPYLAFVILMLTRVVELAVQSS